MCYYNYIIYIFLILGVHLKYAIINQLVLNIYTGTDLKKQALCHNVEE